MRITQARVVAQIFFMGLFLFFAFVTQFGYLKGYPVSLFLEVDPLVAIATALTTHSIYQGLAWSLVLLLPTLLLGRFFCNWICPYGILHQFTGWLFNRRNAKERIESNRYEKLYALKYYILFWMLAMAAFGSLQVGLLDPICLLFRSFTVAVLPAIDMPSEWIYVRPHMHQMAWVVGLLLVFFVSMNLVIPRFFCRVVCPLGATLGILSRFSLFRIERDPHSCVDCDLCLQRCEGASDPHTNLRKSECFVCFNCIDDCPHDALSFEFVAPLKHEVAWPDLSRRRAVFAGLLGVFMYPFARRSGDLDKNFAKEVIRPPGSVAEPEFLERCIKCDQCIRVCPTNVLQPAMLESGIEGVWTPVMNMRMGYCELNCTLCGQVCPTGAIQKISIEQKLGLREFTDLGVVKTGTAFYDRGRCLPWAMDTPCVVCEEVCPTSPKAIYSREVEVTTRYAETLRLRQPYVDPELCIGCGICEYECPVRDERAIRVTAVGETRSTDRTLLLSLIEADSATRAAIVGAGPAPTFGAVATSALASITSLSQATPQSRPKASATAGCGSSQCGCKSKGEPAVADLPTLLHIESPES
ncbi:MAG: 4Fe-4S dicluster domain-containing protein [Gemmatimonadetes bacterium]|nr:4Fe-4S dicluster domain-containing protein [Gemmatimonadota bacterium]